ncbi:MAG: glycosyltransferase [Actinobacteria bacterium]|nr:glycosyltransferase [Actinomycetota bacterium]
MARFLLTSMPYTGHVAPVLAVARELVRRGHHVRFYTGSRFRTRIEAAGVRLVPWEHAPDFDENDIAATFPRMVGEKSMRQLFINMVDCFIRTAPGQVADLTAEWEREPWEALAADETSAGAVLFCETVGRPWSTLAVLPLNLLGPGGPPSGMGIRPGANPVTKLRDAALRGLVPLISRPLISALDSARRDVGLEARGRSFDRLTFSPTLILASGAPGLDYARTDRPEHLHFVGELTGRSGPRSTPLPPWWGDLDGRRVVLVTQGTQNIDPEDLIRPALTALDGRDLIAVATTGIPGVDAFEFDVPANARTIGFAPFAELLPRVDLAITNGGWGGTLAMLAQGIPLVVAGGDLDKPEVAARVAFSGAGVNLRTGTPRAAAVGAAVDRILTDGSFRACAQRISTALNELGGAAHAADLLERAAQAPVNPS